MKKFVAGNWKMNGSLGDVSHLKNIALEAQNNPHIEVALFVPSIYLMSFLKETNGIILGGQDCHHEKSGAFTGDISAAMLKEIGTTHVIIGHSERRMYHAETNDMIAQKAKMAHGVGLKTVLCVGESLEDYKKGDSVSFVREQLLESLCEGVNAENTIIAYEPIWAIGTGLTPNAQEISTIHTAIYETLKEKLGADIADKMRLLYGGSVTGDNSAMICNCSHVHGALVGGASLTAEKFIPIIQSFCVSTN